ncbi:histidine kinase dimerization/phospho-acceptor domain-containing protein [Nocardioides pyridinolyticus]
MPKPDDVERLIQQISHDLRTPLTTILLEVDVLEGLDPSPAAQRSLAALRRAALRLDEVADRVCQLIDRPHPDPIGGDTPSGQDS